MIVLASKSASRRTMLGAAGVEFEVRPPSIDERALEERLSDAWPGEIALALAEAKALSVEGRGRPVLGSDSVVAVEGRRFNKPASRASSARSSIAAGRTSNSTPAAPSMVRREALLEARTIISVAVPLPRPAPAVRRAAS